MNRIYSLTVLVLLSNMMYSQSKYYKYKQQVDSIIANDTTPWKYQLCAYDYSIIGEYRLTLEMWDEPRKKFKTPALNEDLANQFLKYKPVPADKYVIEQSRKTSLLIINEAHHQPCHRVFAESLLKDLYKEGYRYIGFETLGNKDSLLNKRKYPIESSGYYSNEPSFGNLVRSALRLGYTVFPYEADGNGIEREIGQANKIKAFMENNKNGKYIVYCGFDHAIEDSIRNNWKLAMAGRLKALTGINPLTVDQVQLTETSCSDFDNSYRRLIKSNYSSVFIDSAGNAFNKVNQSKTFDLNLYHPDTKYQNGRPHWLYRVNYKPYNIVSKVTIDFPCHVYAYIKSEYSGGVPVDIISLEKKNSDKCLILSKKDKFFVVCKNQKGQMQIIEIK